MSIKVNIKTGLFQLITKNTEYQIKADEYGTLKHVWYGEKTDCDMSYLLEYPNVAFSGNPHDIDKGNYSLDTMPLEYSCSGSGDFRISGLSAECFDGSHVLDFKYKEYKIKHEKYNITGLPAVYDEKGETLEIVLEDRVTSLTLTLLYGVLEENDIITRCAIIANNGKNNIILDKAASMCLDIPRNSNWEWVHFQGRHAQERIPERAKLIHGIQESSSMRGTSSHQQNPSVILCSPQCNEFTGDCIGAFLLYSGSFKTQIELDQLEQIRLVMGINPDLFRWNLKPQQIFETPEVVLTYSNNGFSELSNRFHKVIREHICRGKYKMCERPVLINNWEATYFDFDSEKILRIAKEACNLGVDMFVLDDGWFGERNDDCSSLGDWFVNNNKLKGGLNPLVKKINQMGMKFGIWFEPEMISEKSRLYKEHSDWTIKIPGRKPTLGRHQLVLDLSRTDVQNYLFNSISAILESTQISYIKWDMNRSICDWYSSVLLPDTMGELPHRYILGLYSLLERLIKKYPDVLFEGCSGGGGRFDAGMLYYCPQIWCSDDTDAYERSKIQYGTSFIYPISAVGSHVSIVPNHQTGRITPFETRGIAAMSGSFGYELDISQLTDEEKSDIKKQINEFKILGSLIHNGTYYRLSNPINEPYSIWSFVSQNKKEVLVNGMIFRTQPNMKRLSIKLFGLNPEFKYKSEYSKEIFSGSALMYGGFLLPQSKGDYFPIQIYLKKVE